MGEFSANQKRLLEEIASQCAERGWFFVNAREVRDVNDMIALEKARTIEVEERDVRIDHVRNRVKAGEFVGKLVKPI